MIKPIHILIGASAFTVAACAAPPYSTSEAIGSSTAPQCFLANEVENYTASPDGFVNVKVGADRWFGMRLGNDCPNMDWIMQIAVRPRDSNWLCEGQNSYLIAPDPAGLHRSCFVTGIRRLATPETASAQSTIRSSPRT